MIYEESIMIKDENDYPNSNAWPWKETFSVYQNVIYLEMNKANGNVESILCSYERN